MHELALHKSICRNTQLIFPPPTCSVALSGYASMAFYSFLAFLFAPFSNRTHSLFLSVNSTCSHLFSSQWCTNMGLHTSCAHSPSVWTPTLLHFYMRDKIQRENTISYECVCIYVCALVCIYPQAHTHTHVGLAGSWGRRGCKQAQWDTKPHPPREAKKQSCFSICKLQHVGSLSLLLSGLSRAQIQG